MGSIDYYRRLAGFVARRSDTNCYRFEGRAPGGDDTASRRTLSGPCAPLVMLVTLLQGLSWQHSRSARKMDILVDDRTGCTPWMPAVSMRWSVPKAGSLDTVNNKIEKRRIFTYFSRLPSDIRAAAFLDAPKKGAVVDASCCTGASCVKFAREASREKVLKLVSRWHNGRRAVNCDSRSFQTVSCPREHPGEEFCST
jgi:hypothetical protein